jgi:Sulfotransferase family
MIKEYIRATFNEYKARGFESLPVSFIVSTGRTGTQFFESFFNNNFPDVLCLHEPRPDGFDITIRKIRGKLKTDKIANYLRSNRVGILSRLKKRDAKLYVESNPFFSLLIPELRKAFPTSRFLWIVRNPKTYVVSAYNKSPVGDNKMFFYAENDHRDRITAMDFPNDRWREDWPKFDRFQKVCWYWNKCNEILEQEFGNEGDFLLMKFEELFSSANNGRGICKMLQFFQINVPQGMDENTLAILMKRGTNSSERILLDGAETWTDKQKMDFDTLTYPMRKKLGY